VVPDDVVEEGLHALVLECSAHADRHEGLRESGPDVTAYLEEQPRCSCCKLLQVQGHTQQHALEEAAQEPPAVCVRKERESLPHDEKRHLESLLTNLSY
jgi:hypothetical protein